MNIYLSKSNLASQQSLDTAHELKRDLETHGHKVLDWDDIGCPRSMDKKEKAFNHNKISFCIYVGANCKQLNIDSETSETLMYQSNKYPIGKGQYDEYYVSWDRPSILIVGNKIFEIKGREIRKDSSSWKLYADFKIGLSLENRDHITNRVIRVFIIRFFMSLVYVSKKESNDTFDEMINDQESYRAFIRYDRSLRLIPDCKHYNISLNHKNNTIFVGAELINGRSQSVNKQSTRTQTNGIHDQIYDRSKYPEFDRRLLL